MKIFPFIISIIIFCTSNLMVGQDQISSEIAYQKYQQLSANMAKSFPEDELKTYRRSSFSEQQVETYLSQHIQRMDLLPFIKDKPAFVMDAYLHSGNWFQDMGLVKESINSYQNFFSYYEAHRHELSQRQIDDYVSLVSYAHSMLADNYAQLHLIDSAASQHEMNIRFNDTLSIISYPSALNNYGLFFYLTKMDLDAALLNFKKAYAICLEDFPNHSLIGSIRDNIADIYTDRGEYADALALYEINFDFYQTAITETTGSRDLPRLISAGSQLVQANLNLGKLEEATKVFFTLDSIVADTDKNRELSPDSKLEYLLVKENLHKAKNDISEAYATLAYRAILNDSLLKVKTLQDNQLRDDFNAITVDRVVLKSELDRLEKENKIKSQKTTLWMISLISISIIVVILLLFLNRRQHLVNIKNKKLMAEHQLENTILKVDQLKLEIQSKQRDLSDFALNLMQNQQWAEMLNSKIAQLKSGDSKDTSRILKQLEKEIQNKVQFDVDSQVFYERLDKLNDAFYKHLNNLFPNLTKNEIRLCSLIRLKMESGTIATLQNITLASLNTSRYRMRKKMHLADDIFLDDFIQKL